MLSGGQGKELGLLTTSAIPYTSDCELAPLQFSISLFSYRTGHHKILYFVVKGAH